MAVGATHFALGHFEDDPVQAGSPSDHGADVVKLVTDVIEVKHHQIVLATVNTGVFRQVVEDPFLAVDLLLSSSRGALLDTLWRAAGFVVITLALTTIGLIPSGFRGIELGQWFGGLAPRTESHEPIMPFLLYHGRMADDRRFKVTYTGKRPPYWEVTHADGRWWSVASRAEPQYGYLITNAGGRVLDEFGPTGQKVLDAVHNYERGT